MKILAELSQGIGNILMTTHSIAALKSMGHDIDILYTTDGMTPPYVVSLIYLDNFIDNVFFTPDEPKNEYDAYVSFFGPTLIKVPEGKPFYGVAMDIESVTKFSEVLLNFSIAKELGYTGDMMNGFFQTEVPEGVHNIHNKIVIAPGSKFNRFGMCKKYRGYDLVANALGSERVLFIGTESDRTINKELSKFDWFAGTDVHGLLKCAHIVANCKLLISNDSAFMHLRAITRKPQIAVFGPSGIAKNKPYSENAIVVTSKDKELTCMPCQKGDAWKTCKNDCMNIDFRDIVIPAERFLKEGE